MQVLNHAEHSAGLNMVLGGVGLLLHSQVLEKICLSCFFYREGQAKDLYQRLREKPRGKKSLCSIGILLPHGLFQRKLTTAGHRRGIAARPCASTAFSSHHFPNLVLLDSAVEMHVYNPSSLSINIPHPSPLRLL